MEITYDINKNQRNIIEQELSFDLVSKLDWKTALITKDERFSYGEIRYIALGEITNRIHVVAFTETENGIRVISFRKANKRGYFFCFV